MNELLDIDRERQAFEFSNAQPKPEQKDMRRIISGRNEGKVVEVVAICGYTAWVKFEGSDKEYMMSRRILEPLK